MIDHVFTDLEWPVSNFVMDHLFGFTKTGTNSSFMKMKRPRDESSKTTRTLF